MAFNTGDANNNSAFSDIKNNGYVPPQQQQQNPSFGGTLFGANTIGWTSSNISKTLRDVAVATNEFLTENKNKLTILFDAKRYELQFRTLEISEINEAAPPVLVTYLYNAELDISTYNAILIERQGFDSTVPEFVNSNGVQRPLPRTVSDYWNIEAFHTAVVNKVNESNPIQSNRAPVYCGHVVLPASVDMADKNQVGSFLTKLMFSNFTVLDSVNPSRPPFQVGESNTGVTVRAEYGNRINKDSAGNPIASNAEVYLSQMVKDNIGYDSSSERVFAKANLLVTLDYIYNGWPETIGVQARPRHRAKVVITNMENQHANYSLASQLLTIAAAAAFADDRSRFINALTRNNYSQMVNFGALGLQYPFDPVTQDVTRQVDFSQLNVESMNTYLLRTILPQASVRMHVVNGGDNHWHQADFQRAALPGTPGHKEATERIIAAADELTNGHFSAIWGNYCVDNKGVRTTIPVVQMEQLPVLAGYYTRDGVTRDIREIGFLEVLSMSAAHDGTTQEFRNWYATYYGSGNAIDKLHTRINLYKNKLASGFTLTGYADEIIFTDVFLSCLIQAISATNMRWNDRIDQLVKNDAANLYASNIDYQTSINSSNLQQSNVPGANYSFQRRYY